MRSCVWLGVLLSCMASLGCESSKQVGSACKSGVCPEATAAVQGASCSVAEVGFELAFTQSDTSPLHDLVVCLPTDLPVEDNGIVDCTLYVTLGGTLGDGGTADAGTRHCPDSPWLETAPGKPDGVCRIHQLTTKEREAGKDGWYYDETQNKACRQGEKRIAITDAARPSPDDLLAGTCLSARVQTDDAGAPVPISACGPARANAANHVGDACMPADIPQTGFDDRTATLYTGNDDCGSGACLVYHLRGDPSRDCSGDNCASSDEVASRVFCTCRCDAPAGEKTCECPQGFFCQTLLDDGPNTLRGGYCVHDGT